MSKELDITKAIEKWVEFTQQTLDEGIQLANHALGLLEAGRRPQVVRSWYRSAERIYWQVDTIIDMLGDFRYDGNWLRKMRRKKQHLQHLNVEVSRALRDA